MREMNLVDDLASQISSAVEQLKSIYRAADPRFDNVGKFILLFLFMVQVKKRLKPSSQVSDYLF